MSEDPRFKSTHVDSSISAGECEDATAQTDKPRQALGCKVASIEELKEHFAICLVIGHVCQRDDDSEESQDVNDQNESFQSGQKPAADQVG